MKIETMKTSVLIFLILLSLFLTLRIWNYQPQYDEVNSDRSPIEAKLDGKEETKKSIIQPSKIMFHNGPEHKGLKNKSEESSFYKQMQEWSLYGFEQFQTEHSDVIENQTEYIEVVFPTLLPMRVLQDLFTIDSDTIIPSTSFDRFYLVMNEERTSIQLYFVNTENDLIVSANVQGISEVHQQIEKVNNTSSFIPFTEYVTTEGVSIYLPNEIEMYERPFQANSTSTSLLRNVLFDNPSAVRNSKNASGANIFTDGIRTMVEYEHHIEYTNPVFSEAKLVEGRQLIDDTLDYINAHTGWTTGVRDSYQLYDLNIQDSSILYRLTFDGYPVMENSKYSTIQVTMRNNKINRYNRPLLKLKSSFAGQKAEMRTGDEVVEFLQTSDLFSNRLIEDIAIGYKLEEQQGYIFNLSPAWFIKSYLGWREIDFEQQASKGGDLSAMGSY